VAVRVDALLRALAEPKRERQVVDLYGVEEGV
jgi:hypothetical protein